MVAAVAVARKLAVRLWRMWVRGLRYGEQRESGIIYLKVDPAWDNLRTEAAFQSIEHRTGLQ